MDDDAFWALAYKNEGIPFGVATTVRRIYGEQLGHDYRRLRADDFDPAMFEIDTVEMVIEVEQALGVKISDDEAGETSGSIDSIVRLFARKLEPPKQKVELPASMTDHAPARRTASSGY